MPRKRFTIEQIINHLREAEVLLSQGRTVGEVRRRIGISEQSYDRWRKEYGGLKVNQARRLKELKQAVADLRFEHLAFVILGTPEIVGFAIDADEHVVQMPVPA